VATGCTNNDSPKANPQKRLTPPPEALIPADLSIFRGNLQRNGVFANGGIPSLQGELWRKHLRDPADFAGIIAGDMFVFGTYDRLVGLDVQSGAITWQSPGQSYIHLTNLTPTYRDNTLYYWSESKLHALDMKTQQEKWVYSGSDQPQFYSNAVPVSTLYYGGQSLFGRQGSLQAIDSTSGQPRWTAKFADWVMSDVALDNNIVYFLAAYDRTQPGGDVLQAQVNLYAADAQTGQELWKFEPKGHENEPGMVQAPIVGDGVVYCASWDNAWIGPGRLYAFDGESGAPLWERSIDDLDDNLTQPDHLAYSGGLLYLSSDATSYYGGDATVHAYDGKTGMEKWSFVKGDFMSAPTVSGQTLYITAGYNNDNISDILYALDSDTGKLLREVQLTGAVTRPIVIDHDTIYYSSQNLNIPAFWVGAVR
jgi:outer membrane protein assembly factor BamB